MPITRRLGRAGGRIDADQVAKPCAGDAGDVCFDDGHACPRTLLRGREPAPGADPVVEHRSGRIAQMIASLPASSTSVDEHRLDARHAGGGADQPRGLGVEGRRPSMVIWTSSPWSPQDMRLVWRRSRPRGRAPRSGSRRRTRSRRRSQRLRRLRRPDVAQADLRRPGQEPEPPQQAVACVLVADCGAGRFERVAERRLASRGGSPAAPRAGEQAVRRAGSTSSTRQSTPKPTSTGERSCEPKKRGGRSERDPNTTPNDGPHAPSTARSSGRRLRSPPGPPTALMIPISASARRRASLIVLEISTSAGKSASR